MSLVRQINEFDVKSDERIKRFFLAVQGLQNKLSKAFTETNPRELKISPNKCPYCWGDLKERMGNNGVFLGCSNYPKCTYTKEYICNE